MAQQNNLIRDWVKEAFIQIKELTKSSHDHDIRLTKLETRNKVLTAVFSTLIAILSMVAMYLMFFKT